MKKESFDFTAELKTRLKKLHLKVDLGPVHMDIGPKLAGLYDKFSRQFNSMSYDALGMIIYFLLLPILRDLFGLTWLLAIGLTAFTSWFIKYMFSRQILGVKWGVTTTDKSKQKQSLGDISKILSPILGSGKKPKKTSRRRKKRA